MDLKSTEFEIDQKGVAIIWLSRAERMNAWTGRMHAEYRYLLNMVEQDPNIRGVIVTGRGRGFCVGGDSEALQGHVEKGRYDSGIKSQLEMPGYGVSADFEAFFAYHYGLSKPVLSLIHI